MESEIKKRWVEAISCFMDASINFDELFKNKKKLFGIINVGRVVEKNDRKVFAKLVAILYDSLVKSEADEEKIKTIDNALNHLKNGEIQQFCDHISEVLSGTIDLPFTNADKQIYHGILLVFNGMILKLINKAEEKIKAMQDE